MKTIVMGDLHLKQGRVLPLVDAAVERAGARRVVMCGDYTDEWGASDADELEALALMVAWTGERRRAGMRVDLLMGNHDFAYFAGRGNSGTRRGITSEVVRLLSEAGVTMATSVGDILLTHAGLTKAWAERRLTPLDREAEGETTPADGDAALAERMASVLNTIYKSGDRARWVELDEAGRARGGWGLPGPLWADATELAADPLPGLRQVVGHTPMSTCVRLLDDERHPELPELWACDTFSTYRNGAPIGDGALLLIDDEGAIAALPTSYRSSTSAVLLA